MIICFACIKRLENCWSNSIVYSRCCLRIFRTRTTCLHTSQDSEFDFEASLRRKKSWFGRKLISIWILFCFALLLFGDWAKWILGSVRLPTGRIRQFVSHRPTSSPSASSSQSSPVIAKSSARFDLVDLRPAVACLIFKIYSPVNFKESNRIPLQTSPACHY